MAWLTDDEQRAWQGYRRMRVLLDLEIARDLTRDSGLSEPDYDVLSTLTEHPDRAWRANELAQRLLWSTSRLAHHIGRMERRGLVCRNDSTDDGRAAIVTLTDDGWTAIREAAPAHVASVRRHFIELVTPEQLHALEALSGTVIDHLSGSPQG